VKASEARVNDALQAVRKANDERDAAIAKVVSTTYSSDAIAKQIEQDTVRWREVNFTHLHFTVTTLTVCVKMRCQYSYDCVISSNILQTIDTVY
jgi:hypothetical protein